jgi:hypothetical protein
VQDESMAKDLTEKQFSTFHVCGALILPIPHDPERGIEALIPAGFKTLASEVNVRFWHKADISLCTAHVRFWG